MVYRSYHFFPFTRILHHLRHFKNDIRLTRIRTVHFRKAEWENFEPANKISTCYCLYRVFFMILFIFMLCFSMTCSNISQYKLSYYFIYFTHWTLIIGVLYAVLFGLYILSLKLFHRERKANVEVKEDSEVFFDAASTSSAFVRADESMNVYVTVTEDEVQPLGLPFVINSLNSVESMIWILQTTTFTCSCVSTIGYWGFLFDAEEAGEKSCTLAGQFFVHGFNAILLVIDLLITAVPVHLTHVLYATAYGGVYVLFSGVYHLIPMYAKYPKNEHGEHPFIYNFINWTKYPIAVAATLPVVGFVLVTVLQLCALFLYSIRLHIVYNFFKHSVYLEHLYDYTNGRQKQIATNGKNEETGSVISEKIENVEDETAFAPEEVVTQSPSEI